MEVRHQPGNKSGVAQVCVVTTNIAVNIRQRDITILLGKNMTAQALSPRRLFTRRAEDHPRVQFVTWALGAQVSRLQRVRVPASSSFSSHKVPMPLYTLGQHSTACPRALCTLYTSPTFRCDGEGLRLTFLWKKVE